MYVAYIMRNHTLDIRPLPNYCVGQTNEPIRGQLRTHQLPLGGDQKDGHFK